MTITHYMILRGPREMTLVYNKLYNYIIILYMLAFTNSTVFPCNYRRYNIDLNDAKYITILISIMIGFLSV